MERKVTKLENCHVEVLVTVEEAAWKDAQKKAFEKLAQNVTVDGFRKGKAPEHLVRGKVDPMKVMDEAINHLLPSLYREVIEEEKLQPFAQPKVEISKVSDTELEVRFTVVVAPEVELGKYTGHEIGKEEVVVSAEELNEALTALQSQNASLVLKEGAAEMGDTVVMDFEGFIDGVPFDGGKAENHELELGSHQFIPGFEEALCGHKAEEEFDINVTFPENYAEQLKGKPAVFKIKLHEVKEKQLPELNDELAAQLKIAGVATLDQLKAHKEAELKRQKEVQAKRDYFDKLTSAIAKDSKIQIADEIIEGQVDHVIDDMKNNITQRGLTFEQYLQIVGQKEEDLRAQVRKDSEKEANTYFILKAVGEKENLEVSDAEVEFELSKLAANANKTLDEVKKILGNQVEDLRNNLYMKKVEDFLYDNNK